MNEVVTLIKRSPGTNHIEKRDVFAGLRSIGQTEFYQANAQDIHPECKFVMADYLDYNGETLLDYNGDRFRVLRTYRTGQELELTVVRASAEEAAL
jgi:hypothetical protein